ncbi:MAG: hypothetical protein ABC550_00970 [Candidatus Methanosuratincola petrocarbonis]
MLDDFIGFHSRLPKFILPDFSWRVYVMTVFWHEMAHHVVQDAQMIINGPPPYEYAAYSLMPRQDEEGLCEYMAFTAVERGLGLPPKVIRNIPLRHMLYARTFYPHPRPKIPLLPGGAADEARLPPHIHSLRPVRSLGEGLGSRLPPLHHQNRLRSRRPAVEPAVGSPPARIPGYNIGAGRRGPHLGQDLRDRALISPHGQRLAQARSAEEIVYIDPAHDPIKRIYLAIRSPSDIRPP